MSISEANLPLSIPVVILLGGFPAVGKCTVGRELHNLLNPATDVQNLNDRGEHSTFVHNHLVFDLAAVIADWVDTARHVSARKDILHTTMQHLKHDPEPRSFIFTAQIQYDPERKRVEELVEYITFANDRGMHLFWFTLQCSELNEHMSRAIHLERHKNKLKDTHRLTASLNNPIMRQLTKDDVDAGSDAFKNVHYWDLETRRKEPVDVAREILEKIKQRLAGDEPPKLDDDLQSDVLVGMNPGYVRLEE